MLFKSKFFIFFINAAAVLTCLTHATDTSPGGYEFDEDDSDNCIMNFLEYEHEYLTTHKEYQADQDALRLLF